MRKITPFMSVKVEPSVFEDKDICLMPGDVIMHMENVPGNARRIFAGIDIQAPVDGRFAFAMEMPRTSMLFPAQYLPVASEYVTSVVSAARVSSMEPTGGSWGGSTKRFSATQRLKASCVADAGAPAPMSERTDVAAPLTPQVPVHSTSMMRSYCHVRPSPVTSRDCTGT